MPLLKHLLCSLAVLAMASAQSTSLPTTINADSTSEIPTSYTLTGTSIAAATGTPPTVASTTIHVASSVVTPIPTASPTATSTSTSSAQLSIPAIAGIAAGGALLLIAAAIFLAYTCTKRRRRTHSPPSQWPDSEKIPLSTSSHDSHPLPRRPSSVTTLVDVPAQAYIHSKGFVEYAAPTTTSLHHSKSGKSTHSTNLSRVSEEPGSQSFKFDFSVAPTLEVTPSCEPAVSTTTQVNPDAFQKLVMDKSLPSSPEHEIPLAVLGFGNHPGGGGEGRPRSSVYSTQTGQVKRDTWVGPIVGESQGYF